MNIVELIRTVEKRPRMFLPEESVRYMSAFITGYFAGRCKGFDISSECEDSEIYKEFQNWVQHKYQVETSHGVESITTYWSGGNKESLDLFFTLWNEYCNEKNI